MRETRRGQRIPLLIILTSAAFILIPTTFSAPLSSQSEASACSPTCHQRMESSKLKFGQGKTYSYQFQTEVTTKLLETSDETSKIMISGDAILAAKSACEFVLTVQRAQVVGTTRQITEGVGALEGSSVRFGYQDGSVEGLCVDPSDPSWSANVKRGLVSMLQNKAVRTVGDATVMELDVSGRCPTDYKINGNIFTKTKALSSCTYRDGGIWVLQGTPYQTASDRNSIPLLNSTQNCDQIIDAGIIKDVQCTEEHRLATIAGGQGSVQTRVTTKLSLRQMSNGIPSVRTSRASTSSSILYDHSKMDASGETTRMAKEGINLIVSDICVQTRTGTVTAAIPGLIHSLRKAIRSIRRVEDLTMIYDRIPKQCPNSKPVEKIFMDAAARAGTTESITFMTGLINRRKVDKMTRKIFSIYASYAPKPDAPALAAFTTLILRGELEPEVILAASGLAHRYCRETNRNCGENSDYLLLIRSIARVGLENCMSQESKSRKLGVASLQALGNVNSLPTEAVETIMACMESSDEMSMTALEAFRRDPCQADLKSQAYRIFNDISKSSDIRIQAYLAITNCMEQDDVEKIQQALDDEVSNQVGSFVTSHIGNILSSSNPTKREIRGLFKQLRLSKNFPNDPRKFSKNFDFSTFSPSRNLGIGSEINLIYNQDSYIPRKVTSKLEGQFFGRSYNFIELGLHLEDFEHAVEKYFGPSGKLATTSRSEFASNARNRFLQFTNELQSRFKRDVTPTVSLNEIEDIHSRRRDMKERFGTKGLGDFYVRLLDTTVMSNSFTQEDLREQLSSKTFFSMLDNMMDEAKDHRIELTEPFTFFDEEFVIPTVSGLPLNLELEGTTVLSLQLNGKVDIQALLRGDTNTDLHTRIIPSAATTVRAKMSVGAGPVESGLQLEGKVHTASGVDVAMTRQTGKFELKVNLPEDKVQVLSIRTELFWVEAERMVMKETPLRSRFGPTRSASPFCTLSSLFGLRLCAEVQIPQYGYPSAPSFPLAGDSILGISLEKIEPSMQGYYFKVESSEGGNENKVSVIFDTPGSTTNRKITAEGHYSLAGSLKFDLDLNAPSKHLKIEYQQWNEESLKGVDMNLKIDGDEYGGTAKLRRTNPSSNFVVYEPIIFYTYPGKSANLLSGKVTRDAQNKLEMDIRYGEGLRTNFPLLAGTVTGELTLQPENRRRETQFSFRSVQVENDAVGKAILDGSGTHGEGNNALHLNMKYGKEAQHLLSFDGELFTPTPRDTKFSLAVSSSRRSFLNFDIEYKSARMANGFQNSLLIHRGVDEGSRLTISQMANYKYDSTKIFDIKNLFEVTYPKRGINFYLKADASNGAEQMGDFEFRVGSEVSSIIKYTATGPGFGHYDIHGNVKYPGQTLQFSENVKKVDESKWKYVTSISSNPDRGTPFTFDAETDMTHKYENDDFHSQIRAKVSTSAYPEQLLLGSNVLSRKGYYKANLMVRKRSSQILNLGSEYRGGTENTPSKFTSRAFLDKYLDATLEESHSRGNNDFRLEAVWLPTGRKVVVGSALKKEGETYNLDSSVQWDATRDPSQLATFKSVTNANQIRNGVSMDSKNTLRIINEERRLNLVGKISGEYLNGEISADVTYLAPTGENYVFKWKNWNENSERTKSSVLGFTLALPDQNPIEFELNNRAWNLNTLNYAFDFTSALKVSYKGDQNINLQTEVHSILSNKRTVSALISGSGTILPQPMTVGFNTDFQKGRVGIAGNARYGPKDGSFGFDVDYNTWAPTKTLSTSYKFNTPFSTVWNLEGFNKCSYGFTSLSNFEYTLSGSVSVNNQQNPTTWDNAVSFRNSDFQARLNMNPFGRSLVAFTVKGVVGERKITFRVQNNARSGNNLKMNFDLDRNWPNIRLMLRVISPFPGYEKMEFRLRNKVGSGYITEVQGSHNNEIVTVLSKLNFNEAKKMVELSLTDRKGVKKVSVSVSGLDTNDYNIDTMIIWGEKFISTKGHLLRSGPSVEGDLTLHSPALRANNWNIRVSKMETTNGGNVLSFHAQSAEKEQGSVVIEYAKKQLTFLSVFDGSVAVRANGVDWGGTFQLEDRKFTEQRDSMSGRGVTLTLQLKSEKYPMKLILAGRKTSVENFLSSTLCTDGDEDCKMTEFRLKFMNGVEKGFDFSAVIKSDRTGKTLSDGLFVKTLGRFDDEGQVGTFYEHTAYFTTNGGDSDEDYKVGYRLFKNGDLPEPKSGLEIYFPDREAGILYTKKSTKMEEHLFEAWLDRHRRPDEKLTLSVVHDNQDLYIVVLKHPFLRKDLQIRSTVQTNKNGYLIDTTTEFDIFMGPRSLSVTFKVKKESERRSLASTYAVDLGLRGLITLNSHSDITVGAGELLTKTKLVYVNRERQQRPYDLVLDHGFNHRTLELIGPEGRILMYSSRYSFHSVPGTEEFDGYEVRREIFLPGMADSRIFQNSVTTSLPPSAHLKMYTASSPSGEFYEAWIGFKNDQQFIAGLYSNKGTRQGVIADFTVALNNTRLLFVKHRWNKENVEELLEKGRVRLDDTYSRFKQMKSATSEYMKKEARHVRSMIIRALPNARRVLNYYSRSIDELETELSESKVINHYLRHYFEFILNVFGSDIEEFKQQIHEFRDSVHKVVGFVVRGIGSLPKLLSEGIEGIPKVVDAIEEAMSRSLEVIIKASEFAQRKMSELFDRISKSSPVIGEHLEYLSDTSYGVGKFLKESMVDVLRKMTEVWKSLKVRSSDILESAFVRDYLKYYVEKYQEMILGAIAEYKDELEAFRKSILTALPEKEFQELFQIISEYIENKVKQEPIDEDAVLSEIYEKLVKALRKIRSNILTIDMKNGLIMAQIPLPMPVKSLMEFDKALSSAISAYEFKAPSYDFSIHQIYNQLMSQGGFKNILPPFKGMGVLIGSRYYKTFDDKFYRFEGKCEYVLASDFVDKNFTIVASYAGNRMGSKKAIILTDHKDAITIQPDYTVLINGRPGNVPTSAGDLKVEKFNDWITARGRGFSVSCSTIHDLCTVKVSGFYQGKTNGLLGTLNNENFDDMSSLDGNGAESMTRLAEPWKLGQCEERPLPTLSQQMAQEKCTNAFSGRSSEMRPCFSVVDPTNYQSTCESLSQETGYDVNRAVCATAYAYQAVCQHLGSYIETSEQCVAN